jgi:hypothetical protein
MGRTLRAALLGGALLLAGTIARAGSGTGVIEGTIGYPSEELPAMRVYAVPLEGGLARWVETIRGTSRFAIPDLPPGGYHVIAFPADEGDVGMAGGWTNFVICGMTAQCLQHDLLPVSVTAGKATTGIRIEDWYASPGSFPAEATLTP